MKQSEIETRLIELENRVASLKDLKQKYEAEKGLWEEEDKRKASKIEELQRKVDGVDQLRDALVQLLGPGATFTAKTQSLDVLNLEHQELVVNITHEEKVVNQTTGTVIGKILFCALTELPQDGFTEAELSEALKEHGWNVGHSTLAPTLGGLVRDGNLLRVEGKPARYRLPQKVKLNVVEGAK